MKNGSISSSELEVTVCSALGFQ